MRILQGNVDRRLCHFYHLDSRSLTLPLQDRIAAIFLMIRLVRPFFQPMNRDPSLSDTYGWGYVLGIFGDKIRQSESGCERGEDEQREQKWHCRDHASSTDEKTSTSEQRSGDCMRR